MRKSVDVGLAALSVWLPLGGVALAQTARPDSAAVSKCITAAIQEDQADKVALLKRAMGGPSVGLLLEQRQQQERYCLKVAGCMVGDAVDPTSRNIFATSFASCIEQEVLNQYDARRK